MKLKATKRSTETKSFTVDFRAETTDAGDTIASVVWIVSAGLTVVGTPTNTASNASIKLSSGRHGVPYRVISRATLTTSTQVLEKVLEVEIDDYAVSE